MIRESEWHFKPVRRKHRPIVRLISEIRFQKTFLRKTVFSDTRPVYGAKNSTGTPYKASGAVKM
jgi:hypothetical protein